MNDTSKSKEPVDEVYEESIRRGKAYAVPDNYNELSREDKMTVDAEVKAYGQGWEDHHFVSRALQQREEPWPSQEEIDFQHNQLENFGQQKGFLAAIGWLKHRLKIK